MLTQKAIDRLLAVKKHILEEPRRFDMKKIRTAISSAPCGTTCCIAGWLIKLENPNREPLSYDSSFWERGGENVETGDINEAALLIGDDKHQLFFESGWPEELMEAYRYARTPPERAKAGADAIDAYIAAGGNW